MKYFFKAYAQDAALRAIIDDGRFAELYVNQSFGTSTSCPFRGMAKTHPRVREKITYRSTNSCETRPHARR